MQEGMWWGNLEQGLGVEMGIDEVGVQTERCNGLIVPWSW